MLPQIAPKGKLFSLKEKNSPERFFPLAFSAERCIMESIKNTSYFRRTKTMKYGFGIDLGGTTVKIAYLDENGTMLEKWEIPTVTANGGAQILPDIAASVKNYL